MRTGRPALARTPCCLVAPRLPTGHHSLKNPSQAPSSNCLCLASSSRTKSVAGCCMYVTAGTPVDDGSLRGVRHAESPHRESSRLLPEQLPSPPALHGAHATPPASQPASQPALARRRQRRHGRLARQAQLCTAAALHGKGTERVGGGSLTRAASWQGRARCAVHMAHRIARSSAIFRSVPLTCHHASAHSAPSHERTPGQGTGGSKTAGEKSRPGTRGGQGGQDETSQQHGTASRLSRRPSAPLPPARRTLAHPADVSASASAAGRRVRHIRHMARPAAQTYTPSHTAHNSRQQACAHRHVLEEVQVVHADQPPVQHATQ
eukprot:SAG25_NODE_756_length_5536_cov_5.294464_2_plen_321_part_00